MKTVFIKLTKAAPTAGPFNIYDGDDTLLMADVTKKELVEGLAVSVDDGETTIVIVATGDCPYTKEVDITEMTAIEYLETEYEEVSTGCLWKHLADISLYNSFYGKIKPYIIEYPFAYKIQDEILQSITDYTKAYQYLPSSDGVFNYNTRVEVDNKWFNAAVLYNDQQSTGTLLLNPKPLHNMQLLMSYPIYNSDSKSILYTKSDGLYSYNTFWALQKSSTVPLFVTSCESLSIDRVVNDENMDYSIRSFNKAPLRSKNLRVRHILQDTDDVHLVSNFILGTSQISFK